MDEETTENELLPVNVWLAGRSYRIRVPAGEEAAVRRAVKAADAKIRELRLHYTGRDDQDFIAMCLLMYATAGTGAGADAAAQEEITAMIRKIDKVLSEPPAR